MITIFDKKLLTPEQKAARYQAKNRLLTRRAALFLGLPIPEWAARKWGRGPWSLRALRDQECKYYFAPDYVPTAPEVTFIRKLCREHNIPVPAVAARKKYKLKKRFSYYEDRTPRYIRDKES